jgi:hypothetical protein
VPPSTWRQTDVGTHDVGSDPGDYLELYRWVRSAVLRCAVLLAQRRPPPCANTARR